MYFFSQFAMTTEEEKDNVDPIILKRVIPAFSLEGNFPCC